MNFDAIKAKALQLWATYKKEIMIGAGILAAIFLLPKVLKMLKGRPRRRRTRTVTRAAYRRRKYSYKPTSKRPPKGSAAMRRKMARLRALRRK
jgi:hypothetical protein